MPKIVWGIMLKPYKSPTPLKSTEEVATKDSKVGVKSSRGATWNIIETKGVKRRFRSCIGSAHNDGVLENVPEGLQIIRL